MAVTSPLIIRLTKAFLITDACLIPSRGVDCAVCSFIVRRAATNFVCTKWITTSIWHLCHPTHLLTLPDSILNQSLHTSTVPCTIWRWNTVNYVSTYLGIRCIIFRLQTWKATRSVTTHRVSGLARTWNVSRRRI